MTRLQSFSNFQHIFGAIFPESKIKNILFALDNEGVEDIIDFINIPHQELADLEYISGGVDNKLPRKDVHLLKNIHDWASYLFLESTDQDWRSLDEFNYDAFLSEAVFRANSIAKQVETTKPKPISSSNAFLSNVKLDLKTFPTFDGKKEHWLKFKRSVLSIAYTHGLQGIFDFSSIPPLTTDPDYQLYQAQNTFVYSLWVSRIHDGYPVSIIRAHEDSRDGRQTYIDMVTYFESTNNLEQLSLLTFNRLTELTYSYKYPGGLPKFLHKFCDLMMDLEDAGKPMDPAMVKSLFLSKIQDKEYKHLVDTYINDADIDFEACAQNLIDKYERLTADKSTSSTRSVNSSTTPEKAVSLTPAVLAEWRNKWRLPKPQWQKLTPGQKDHLIKIRKKEDLLTNLIRGTTQDRDQVLQHLYQLLIILLLKSTL